MCNTSHEIMITSQNGGLVNTTYAGASPPPLPAGFTWKRNMVYSAQWQDDVRSEEHTSELQSLMRISYAVFCLKKKRKKHTTNIYKHDTCQDAQDYRTRHT